MSTGLGITGGGGAPGDKRLKTVLLREVEGRVRGGGAVIVQADAG